MSDILVSRKTGIPRDLKNGINLSWEKQDSLRFQLGIENKSVECYLKKIKHEEFPYDRYNIGIVKENKINIDGKDFERSDIDHNVFVSTDETLAFNIKILEFVDINSYLNQNRTKQEIARKRFNAKDDQYVFPKSRRAVDITNPRNLAVIMNDEITIDGVVYKRLKAEPNLFISPKLNIFDITTFNLIKSKNIKVSDAQKFAKKSLGLPEDYSEDVHPTKFTSHIAVILEGNFDIIRNNRFTMDGIKYVRHPTKQSLFISENLKVFNIAIFDFMESDIYNLHEEFNAQQLAQLIMQSSKLYYPNSKKSDANLFNHRNLKEIESNEIIIDRKHYKKVPLSERYFINNAMCIFDIQTFTKITSENMEPKLSNQQLAQAILGTKKLCHPISTKIKVVLQPNNLRKITKENGRDVIAIDKCEFFRSPKDSNLFISGKLLQFNTETFELNHYDFHNDFTTQEFGQFILNTTNEVYPCNKVTRENEIFTREMLREVENNKLIIGINVYQRHPHKKNLFISSKFKVFDIDTFNFINVNLDDLTAQELAHCVVVTDHLLCPSSTSSKFMFTENNLTTLGDDEDEIIVNSMTFYRSKLDRMLFTSKDETSTFNLNTFQFEINKSSDVTTSAQDKARKILKEDSAWIYPKNTHRLNMFTGTNLIKLNLSNLNEYVLINNVQMRQHPYFKNLLGNKSGEIFDLNTFQFLANPDRKFTLPFIRGINGVVEIDDEHVFETNTLTINNQEVDWNDILNVKLISELRYPHPIYEDYYVDFYGNPFKYEIDLDTEKTKSKRLHASSFGSVTIMYQGIIIYVKYEHFAYECFNNTTTESKISIINNNYSYTKYRCCKWNLRIENSLEQSEKSNLLIHPSLKFNMYAYDPKKHAVYSFYGADGGQYIKTYANFIRISDGTNKYRNQRAYPLIKFIYECSNQIELNDEDFVVNNNVIKFGTPTFDLNGETFIMSEVDKRFYRNEDYSAFFYTEYNDFLSFANGKIIIRKHGPVTVRISDLWK